MNTGPARLCPLGRAARSDCVGKGAGEAALVAPPVDAPLPTLRSATSKRAKRPSVLQLVFQARAFAHVRAPLVLLNVGLVIDRGLQHHLLRHRLLAQVSRRDLDGEAA